MKDSKDTQTFDLFSKPGRGRPVSGNAKSSADRQREYRIRKKSDLSIRPRNDDFARGYFCAVAVLLRDCGVVTTQVRDLFNMGGDAEKLADDLDKKLFFEHGLLPYN